jgi:hypothetical protein
MHFSQIADIGGQARNQESLSKTVPFLDLVTSGTKTGAGHEDQ